MTTVFSAILGCLLATQPPNAELTKGIYFLSRSNQGVEVERADGGVVVLGERATAAFGRPSLRAISNDNSLFHLDLIGAGPFPKDAASRQCAVYIDGVCAIAGSHSNVKADGTMDLGIVRFPGRAAAEKVARALDVKPMLRQHPGHHLLTSFHPLKASFAMGEPVVFRMEIKNVGTVAIQFMAGGRDRGARDNQFDFIARRAIGTAIPDTGDPQHEGGLMEHVTLRPGDAFTKEVDLTKWFNFPRQGSYTITCLYHLELFSEAATKPIWDEFATDVCSVRIAPGDR